MIELRTGHVMSEIETRSRDMYFKQLIDFLDEFGLNPGIDVIKMASAPFVLSEGTHRLGWICSAFSEGRGNNFYVPVSIGNKTPRFNLDGEEYYKQRGITSDETILLKEEYNKLIKATIPKTCICGFIKAELFTDRIKDLLNSYGRVDLLHQIQGNIISENTKKYRCYFDTKEQVQVFSIRLNKQSLYYSHGKVQSKTIDEIRMKIVAVVGQKWGYIAPTITDSIELYMRCNVDKKKEITK